MSRIESDGPIRRLVVSIDTARDLAPQVALYRELGIPWKLLCDLTERRKQTLERAIERWLLKAGRGSGIVGVGADNSTS